MRILVCGGRNYANEAEMAKQMAFLTPKDIVIQGGARGADHLASTYCWANGIHCAEVKALWGLLGRSAGPERNAAMLMLQPDRLIAFPGGRGTASMIAKARAAVIPVVEVQA